MKFWGQLLLGQELQGQERLVQVLKWGSGQRGFLPFRAAQVIPRR
jgi:hypothetical protein